MKKQFLIIGLGRFGASVARTLSKAGHTVIGIDQSEDRIQRVASEINDAIKCDATDAEILDSLGIRDFEAVIVAIGEKYIQNSILVTLILKEKGAKKIIAKAGTQTQGRVLSKVGADTIVYPEKDMGERVAKNLISTNVLDFLEVGSEISIIEIIAPAIMVGHSLIELNLRNKYGINIISIKTNKNEIKSPPDTNYRLQPDDIVTLIGENRQLKKLGFIE
ncbi:MAG: Ktr system potassium uptake protein A [Actinobacteria bacterium ADurb.Bin346]|nr:MAG: Ktr system potassium uptake protein A [Actinobacteria bacterium ADurb.Bin346]